MKKLTFIFAALLVLSACKKDLTSLNVDPKNPATVPSYSLFTEAERLLTNTVTSSSVNLNIFRLIEQQWTETQYLNETQYQFTYRKQPDGIWTALYTNTLSNFQKAKEAIPVDVKDAVTQKNEIAIADILQVYTYYYLVTSFGNIPYTEALDISKPFPKYDDAKTIYSALLTRLDTDIAALDVSGASYGSADLVYTGNVAKWKTFANSLKLKMGMTIADSDVATAKATVEAAVKAGVFASNNDNAVLQYVSTPPNTNPIWVDLIQSQRHDFVATSQFMDLLHPGTATQDPRLPYYFAPTTRNSAIYVGADNGSGDGTLAFALYSMPSGPLLTPGSIGSLTNPDFPGVLLDYSEVAFNLAEAAQRGFNVNGTALTFYNAAVTASITYWGGSTTDAATYLTFPGNAYTTTAGSTNFNQIALQEYLALYNRGWDAWIVNRKLDYPKLVPPPNAFSDFPVRLTYPISEQNVNKPNYDKASTAIGGDLATTKLFFDTK